MEAGDRLRPVSGARAVLAFAASIALSGTGAAELMLAERDDGVEVLVASWDGVPFQFTASEVLKLAEILALCEAPQSLVDQIRSLAQFKKLDMKQQ